MTGGALLGGVLYANFCDCGDRYLTIIRSYAPDRCRTVIDGEVELTASVSFD